jgi:hypothetical protein
MSTLSGLLSLVAFTGLALAASFPKTDTFRVRGNTVTALFIDPKPDCIETSASISASEETNHNGGSPKQFSGSVFLNITKINLCTGEKLLDANGFQLITDSSFQVASSLGTATLNVDTPAFDMVSGRTFEITVALVWNATEGVSSGHSVSHSRFAGTTLHSTSNGASRGALATGRFAMTGVDLAASPAVVAYISKYTNGTVTITH